jgi:hypothetical protein
VVKEVESMSEHRHWDSNVGMDVVRYDLNDGHCDRCGELLDTRGYCSNGRCPYHELAPGHAYLVG